MTASSEKPFGVYVHWPFCAAKCPYCDFNSHVRHHGVDQDVFVEAFEREIAHMAAISGPQSVSSIFFGGGTPSLMEPATVERILSAIAKEWTLPDTAEISMEANPTSVEAGRFRDYRSAGVNRVSLGIQSLDDAQLKFLGRQHDSKEAVAAIRLAQSIFPRMSFDLIYARPGQTAENWKHELETAIELSVGHLSLYQLTIEEGTRFFDLRAAGKLNPLQEEPSAELYELTQQITTAHGYRTYEISNHAMPGHECLHNLVYWRGQDYAGIGPGAHGRLTTPEGRLATATIKHPETWWQAVMTNGHGMEDRFHLATEEHADEFILMGLRLAEGIDPVRFERLRGVPIDPERRDFLLTLGLVEEVGNGNLRATPKGFLVLDAVVADLAA
ncbi:MAG: radical SAM family heme chaperone HemW [Pseudomonadota bacterium]